MRIRLTFFPCTLPMLIGLFLSSYPACSESVAPPPSARLNLSVTVVDTSLFSRTLFQTTAVESAQVFINSISFYNYLESRSDSSGLARFEKILPDRYNISATKSLTAEQCSLVTGSPVARVLNGQLQNVEISGSEAQVTILVQPALLSQVVFSEIYYNGSPVNPMPYYFHDQFTEIYNNSAVTVYLDSLIIADAEYGYIDDQYIHSVHAYMFPGDGDDYPLAPGQMILVAQDAINHSANHSVDLSGAEFEYYVKDQGDVDNPNSINMIPIHHKYGVDFLYSVMNSAIVLLKVRQPYAAGYDNYNQIMFPKSAVLDGIEYRVNLSEVEYKRLDPSIDAGLTGGFERYNFKSVQRRIERWEGSRAILMDNNNSSIDFQVVDRPTPRYFFEPGGKR